MPGYAYRTSGREAENMVRADDVKNCKGVRFFCTDPLCEAYLFVRHSRTGNVHFYASSGHGHCPSCTYAASEFTDKDFDYDQAIERFFIEKKGKKAKRQEKGDGLPEIYSDEGPKVPSTLRQIYSVCKGHLPSDRFGDYYVKWMLLDKRSASYYSKGLFGLKIVEAEKQKYYYSEKSQRIYMKTDAFFDVELHFDSKELFWNAAKGLTESSSGRCVVAGNWKYYGKQKRAVTEVTSKTQLLFV